MWISETASIFAWRQNLKRFENSSAHGPLKPGLREKKHV